MTIAARLTIAAVALAGAGAADAAVSLTGNGTYSETFDSLVGTGSSFTNSALPAGWVIDESGGGARDNDFYAVDTGSSSTGDTYSYGTAGSTDRALGALRSGSLVPLFGASFQNNAGASITDLAIGYTGEEWRLGTAGRTDRLNFEYSTNATSLTTGTWTGVTALNFTTPNTVTVGAKNGNAAGNFAQLSGAISGLNIANAGTFWIRFTDLDATGADDGLAVDNFNLSATLAPTAPVPEPGEWAMMAGGLGLVGAVAKRRRKA